MTERISMPIRPYSIAVVVLCGLGVAFAQDPTKVEAAHYKIAFENSTVQVVDVHYGPHEKSGLHDHPGGVVVVITGGHLRFTDQSGTVTEVFSKPGESRWFPPFRHKVENVGETPYNAVYIGIKAKRAASKTDPDGESPQLDAETAKIVAQYLAEARAQ
jgi:quercetin dioxygenase-like cupin family protein